LILGEYEGLTSCRCSAAPRGAITWFFNPSTVYSPNGFSLRQTLLTVNLNEGWQSGSFGMWLETGASIETYFPRGIITGSRAVPEPATVFMLALGVLGVARLRKRAIQVN
jgi:hypothetical protein